MRNHSTLSLIAIFALLPSVAVGQNIFDEYRKRKEKQQEEYLRDSQQQQNDYKERKRKEFDEYRRKKNEEFARLLAQPWQKFEIEEGIKHPIEEELKPVIYEGSEYDDLIGKEVKGELLKLLDEELHPQPEPDVPIIENDEANGYSTFTFYGTQMKVRLGGIKNFHLTGSDENAVAKAYKELTATQYNNLMSDCLKLRTDYSLCDWAYYKMLEQLANTACGKGTNEAVFLHGFLFQESGYLTRFAFNPSDNRLHLLVRMNGNAYYYGYFIADGKAYYLFDGSKAKNLKITNYVQPNGREMRMEIDKLPKLNVVLSSQKVIRAASFPIVVSTNVNKNLVDFFNDYPTSYCNDEIMTRWAYYANTPLSDEVKKIVYPELRKRLLNTTPLMAANMLLNWVQPLSESQSQPDDGTQIGFPYLRDDVVWGKDRAFFAEETLYYPGSDCEDHAIFFSHLVRDILGLDVVLVYYPNHLATAICFDDDVQGDYVMVDGRKFVVADPTYTRAHVGMTMPNCEGKEMKVIPCKR